MTVAAAAQNYLLYFVVPLWLLAGAADWLCHRLSRIEETSGFKESMIHGVMLLEVGSVLLLALFFQINALIIALGVVAFLAHEATALWDLHYAAPRRAVSPWEQHVHDFLSVIPLMALSFIVVLHWPQALALVGLGPEPADLSLRLKDPPLPPAYLAAVVAGVVLLGIVPYAEELIRTWRARQKKGHDRSR